MLYISFKHTISTQNIAAIVEYDANSRNNISPSLIVLNRSADDIINETSLYFWINEYIVL